MKPGTPAMTAPLPRRPWHAIPAADVATELGCDPARGLDAAEAAARLLTQGPNRCLLYTSRCV